ncbi:hypothetical protein NQZ68_009891 [Dissostichus eleginoides]|nr:hypothetical protein NQZ68_009891 [Dissostichus eleginoides]
MKQRPGSWPLKTPQEPRIAELEKQVSALTESLDMAENYSRRLNIQVVGLAEGTETGQPVDFFESWLPRTLGIATKAGRYSHTRSVELTTPLNFRQRSAIQDLRHRERRRVNTAALSCVCDGGRETNVDYYNNVEESSSEGSFLSDGSSSSSDSTITLESTILPKLGKDS